MQSSPWSVPRPSAAGAAIAGVFIVTFAVRWLTLNGLGGDDHWSLWTAATFLKGDIPFRDFVDVGDPLYWGISALAQWSVGYRVIGEVALGTTLVAAGIALSFHLATMASGSRLIAAALTSIVVLLMTTTKLYSYPKIFVYPLGIWLGWRYLDRPTLGRAFALACGVVIAFGYRHDHGAYVGVGAAAAVLLAHRTEGVRGMAKASMRGAACTLLLLAPYLIAIQAYEGVVAYFTERMAIGSQLDQAGRRLIWFSPDSSAPPELIHIDPPTPVRVQVDWKGDTSPATRVALERQYSLTNGVDPRARLYEYHLTNLAPANLLALATDARVAAQEGLVITYRALHSDGVEAIKVPGEAVADELLPASGDGAPAALVLVRWQPGLTPAERIALEREFGLRDPAPDRQRWEYALTDPSSANIRALVEDPRVSDTGLLDREAFRPLEDTWMTALQRRLPLLRAQLLPRWLHNVNAAVWLYYVAFSLPFIILAMLAADWMRGRAAGGMSNAGLKMGMTAAMLVIANLALLRKAGYVADHADVAAVLAAWVIGRTFANWRTTARGLRTAAAVTIGVVIAVSTWATIAYAQPARILANAGLDGGIAAARAQAARTYRNFAASPPIDGYAPPGTTGDRAILRYVYECTRPEDRIWMLTDAYSFPYYTERRVVRHIYWAMNFQAGRERQQQTIADLEREPAPLVISIGGQSPLEFLEGYDLLHAYAAQRYTNVNRVLEDNTNRGLIFWILADNRRTPTGTYELLGLPCFT